MNYIDLFHGIGGFALGAYWAGMKFDNHFCSDIEPYCQKLYAQRFPDSIQLGDITKIDTGELLKYGNEWIISGGFPCQDVSISGHGKGVRGGVRSGLWFEYWRIIRDLRPKFCIMENVSALTYRGLDAILGSLSEIGYDAEWQTLRACQFGLPHQRSRMWIVAYPDSIRFICEGKEKKYTQKILSKQTSRQDDLSGNIEEIINECDCETLPGCDGIPGDVDEIRGLGNSIVPQIAELLFNQIKPLL